MNIKRLPIRLTGDDRRVIARPFIREFMIFLREDVAANQGTQAARPQDLPWSVGNCTVDGNQRAAPGQIEIAAYAGFAPRVVWRNEAQEKHRRPAVPR